jgi:hypothetical protein
MSNPIIHVKDKRQVERITTLLALRENLAVVLTALDDLQLRDADFYISVAAGEVIDELKRLGCAEPQTVNEDKGLH